MDPALDDTGIVEAALVRRAQGGEVDAFAQLVRRYQRRAVSVAYRLLNHAEDATDVSQEAFVRAFQNLDQLADPAKFGAWLMRAVTNLALNFRRSRRTRRAASLDDTPGFTEPVAPATAALTAARPQDAGALPEELHEAITAAMEELPEKQRLALVLFSVEGLPQKQVAEILECSVELVKWNVFQARKKLKDLLAVYLS